MKEGAIDVAGLERQLAELCVPDGQAGDVLMRLAEVIFPGQVGVGDRARTLWPETDRDSLLSAGDGLDDQERLLAQIRRSEDRFRSLVEQLPAVVFFAALGGDANEVYVSPQIETLLGFTQQEWLTNPLLWYSQLHPDDHDIVIEAFTKGVQTGGPFRAQVRFFARDGSEVWILGEARLILDEAERPAYFQGVAFDITPSKRAEAVMAQAERAKAEAAQLRADAFAARNVELTRLNDQLRVAKEQAEAAARARSTFLTTMSHELRTPLNSVIVLAGLLADGELTLSQRDMVRRMRLASDHLLELINDVLEFSRLRAGQVELDRHTFDLEIWLSDTVEIIAPRAGEKGLELCYHIAPDVPRTLTTDGGRLRQVLLNLLANAVKFTAFGEVEIAITAQPFRAAAQLVGTRPSQTGLWEFQCVVRDTGVGVRPDAILFDEFRQADSGIAREYGGTGLGLAICRRLCELLDGRIWATTGAGALPSLADPGAAPGPGPGPGPGATFTFTWMAEADETSVPAVAAGVRVIPPRRQAGPDADPVSAPTKSRRGLFGRSSRADRRAGGGAGPGGAAAGVGGGAGAAVSRGRIVAGEGPIVAGEGDAPLRILLVEDDLMNREVAQMLLGALGQRADMAESGAAAIEAIRARRYDIVLMDVAMPTTDGLSTTRAIRRLGGGVHQPYIVALTANALPGDKEECILAGMNAYVAKPIERRDLARALAHGAQVARNQSDLPHDQPPLADRPLLDQGGPGRPGFDPTKLTRILTQFGPDPLQRLLSIFRSDAPGLADTARTAVAAGDADGAFRAAHTLKSSAASIGAADLAAVAAELEALARGGSLTGAAPLADELARCMVGTMQQLDRFEAGIPS